MSPPRNHAVLSFALLEADADSSSLFSATEVVVSSSIILAFVNELI